MLDKAGVAVTEGSYQWGLQLTSCLSDCGQETARSRQLRGECLRKLAGREVSAPGMNWYLTEDLVQEGLEIKPNPKMQARRIMAGDIRSLFRMLTVMVDSEAAQDINTSALFRFSDTSEEVCMVIRRGICFLTPTTPENTDIKVDTTSKVWRELMAKQRTALAASISGELKVRPSIASLATFMTYFDTET